MAQICLQCIGDEALRSQVKDASTEAACSFCHEQRLGISLRLLAETVDPVLREYCQIGELSPVFRRDYDEPDFEEEGESLVNLLEAELDIPYEAAEQLAALLVDLDPACPQDGDIGRAHV